MIIVKLIVLAMIGIVLPTVIGGTISVLMGGKAELKSAYLWGWTGLLALFVLMVKQPIKMKERLSEVAGHTMLGLLGVIAVAVLLFVVMVFIKRKKKERLYFRKLLCKIWKEIMIVVAVSVALSGVSLCVNSNREDYTTEIVNTMYMRDTLYEIDPMSGKGISDLNADEQQFVKGLQESPIELLYAVGVNKTRIYPAKFVNMILPFLLFPFYVSTFMMWGDYLFGEARAKKIFFQIMVWLLLGVGLVEDWNYVFDIFANPWNGETLFFLGLIPFTIFAFLDIEHELQQKKYRAVFQGLALCLAGKLLYQYGLFIELFLIAVYGCYFILRRYHNGTSDRAA